jgi:hypothetical protein
MNDSLNDSFQSPLDALSSSLDTNISNLTDNQQSFAQDHQTNSLFDYHSLVETHQIDHFSQDHHWNDTSFHSAPEHSLTQDVDALLNGNNSSDDDSSNQNTANFTMPTFQHHVHYHPPHEHFQVPFSHEGELQHVASSENCTFHSSLDENNFGDANPYATVKSDGHIYKHVGNDTTGDWIATVHDGKVYNLHDDYLGRAGTDGNVYNEHDKVIGYVDNKGHVFDSVGHHVCNTTTGTVGAAAYLLTIYNGNVA